MLEKLGLVKTNCDCCGRPFEQGGRVNTGGVSVCDRCAAILFKYGLEPQDINVFTHAQLNVLTAPNISAERKLQEFIVENPMIALHKGEVCFYRGQAQGGKIQNRVVGYKSGSRGVSIRIMKGVTYHVGQSSPEAVRQDVLEKSNMGTFIMTGQRFILQTDRYGFELKGQDLQTANLHKDGIEIFAKGRQYLVLTNDVRYIAKVMELISECTNEQRAAKELEAQRKLTEKNNSIKTETINEKDIKKPQSERKTSSEKSTANKSDLVSQLQDYKKLLDDGIITQDEFDQLKKQALGL